jgi:hypothetical protein
MQLDAFPGGGREIAQMDKLPAVIEAGSKSPLAILALCICFLAILALTFFRSASERTRVIIFFVILFSFVGALAKAYIDWRNTPPSSANSIGAPPAQADSASQNAHSINIDERESDSLRPPQKAPQKTEGQADDDAAYDLAEQKVTSEARLTGSVVPINFPVRPGEWNKVDAVSDYDPQACVTTAMRVRLANRPLHGEFRVEGECRMVSGPATAVYYKPKAGYYGKDIFSYMVPQLDRTTIIRTNGVGSQ